MVNRLYKILFLISIILVNKNAISQNLVFNGGFEALNICTEFSQACSPVAWFNINPAVPPLIYPNAVPKPLTGADLLILPIENVFSTFSKRAYVYSILACPMQKGKQYNVVFYLHTAGKILHEVDFYFSTKEFYSNTLQPDTLTPSITISDTNFIKNKNGWNYIQATYTALGGEQYFLLGNLSKKPFKYTKDARMNRAGDIFYFVDDISISPTIALPICNTFSFTEERVMNLHNRHTETLAPKVEADVLPYINDTLTIPAVFFETDKALIKTAYKQQLDKMIIKFAKKNIVKIEVEGHTDNTGTLERNVVLSQDRANAVLSYFLANLPYEVIKAYAIGKADKIAIADNNTIAGRAKNRRVQIVVSYIESKQK